ncbi:hypothetical protein [Leptospira stimsonii]|uniref:Uncharacterized protein n=1 Tax=Leptospira stimsonii TaxID=2202203 RepID=A0A8B3CYJ9_9LEPT|nr:hypothetical protein [Leptospira stimsonii]RHX88760.1 hypothetical protein DLM78_07535 [Leptospira stimsonii]
MEEYSIFLKGIPHSIGPSSKEKETRGLQINSFTVYYLQLDDMGLTLKTEGLCFRSSDIRIWFGITDLYPTFPFPLVKGGAGVAQSYGPRSTTQGPWTWSNDTNTWLAFTSASATGSKGITRDESFRL